MRLKIEGLLPGTDYAIQVRAVNDKTTSEWSRKFGVKTVKDTIAPQVPTNFTWVIAGNTFHGEWDAVTKNTANHTSNIVRYEIELQNPSLVVKAVSVPQHTDGRVIYNLTATTNKSLFGTAQATLSARVRAVDIQGLKGAWTEYIEATRPKPGAPTDAVVVEINDGVNLSWTEPADTSSVEGYRVYGSTTESFVPSIANRLFSGNATAFNFVSSTYAPFFFVIRSYDTFGAESDDLLAEGTPKSPFAIDDIAPDAPTGFTVTLSRTGNVAAALCAWTQTPTDDMQGFVIRWRKSGATYYTLEMIDKAATNANIPLPEPFADYEFSIASFDWAANYSAYTVPVTLVGSVPGPPPAVTGVVGRLGLDTLELNWAESTALDVQGGAGKYKVQIDTVNTFNSTDLLNYDTGNLSITVSGLVQGETYYWRVAAVDTTGQTGAYSATGSGPTLQVPAVAGPVDGLVPAAVGTVTPSGGFKFIYASWAAVTTRSDGSAQPANSPIAYEVHAATTAGFTKSSSTLITQTSGTSAVIKRVAGADVVNGTPYFIRVYAKDADGLGASSPEANISSTQIVKADITTGIIDASMINTGVLQSSIITMGPGGVIQSNNYIPGTSGYIIDENGMTVNDGAIRAESFSGGTFSGKTLIIGAGGVLRVDSTAVIKSNNYSPGVSGWSLGSNGLEINNLDATISADNITGGTFNGGAIYVASGGGIYDTNGFWSITPSSISIQNGSISASTINAGQLASSQRITVNGVSRPYWIVDMEGDAQFGNVQVRGHMLVGAAFEDDAGQSYIQSGNYSPGSTGWKIDSLGNADLNSATIQGTIQSSGFAGAGTGWQMLSNGNATITNAIISGRLRTGTGSTRIEVWDDANYYGDQLGPGAAGVTFWSNGSTRRIYGNSAGLGLQTGGLMVELLEASGVVSIHDASGGIQVDGASNIAGRIMSNSGVNDSSIVFIGDKVVIATRAMNSQTPGSGNTRDIYYHQAFQVTGPGTISDRSLKEDIIPISNAIDIVKQIQINSFKLKYKYGDFDPTYYGVIAQELQPILPDSVVPGDQGGPLSVAYNDVFALTTAATRELIVKNEVLEAQIADLTSRLAVLEQS